jgi:uncharacterized protein (DUF2062 family)
VAASSMAVPVLIAVLIASIVLGAMTALVALVATIVVVLLLCSKISTLLFTISN